MPVKRKIKITAAAVIIISILTLIILFLAFRFFKISYNLTEKADINSKIIISRDSKGIPSIITDSRDNFYFALGYLHAKDRLSVIEYLRAIATGNSEGFAGDDSIILNNICTTIGFTKNAEKLAAGLKENEKNALRNYVNGINFIRNKTHIRNFTSREWQIEDILAILTMKEWGNSYLNNRELIFNMPSSKISQSKNIFNDDRYLFFYNEDDDIRNLYTVRRIKELIEKYICTFARGNSIYTPQNYSTSGNEIFSTLNYEDYSNQYPGWYPVKLELSGKKIFTITYSGLPFIISFKNQETSLTQININSDSQTFYLFDTEYRNSVPGYKYSGTWKEYKSVRIPSFNKKEVSSEIKWITEKGPVISDLINSAKTDSKILVIDSIMPGLDYVSLMLNVPFESDIEKIKQSVSSNDSTLKCFIVSGSNKAYKVYSGFINRDSDNNQLFVDGSKTSLKSSADRISVTKTISEIEFSGSDLVQGKELPLNYYKNTVTNQFKTERFISLLVPKTIYDENYIQNILTDNVSIAAYKFVPHFSSLLTRNFTTSSKLSKIYFSDWNFSCKSALQSPSIFYAALEFYIKEAYKDDFGKDAEFNLNSSYLLYPELLDQFQRRLPAIFDKPETEKVESKELVFDIAFLNAMRFLNRKEGPLMENWKWGLINKTSFKIPEENLTILSRFFGITPVPMSGGPDTIENIQLSGNFSTVSSTSFQSYMNRKTFNFKMNTGYSTSFFSDFYYGSNIIKDFENIDNTDQLYKTIIRPLNN